MNSKEYREFLEAYKNVYEQQIGVPLKDASDRAAKQQLQKMIPKGEKVYTPKSTLQNAHYEPDGDLVDEQRVIDPPSSGGIELPFRSVDGLIKGGAASGIPNIPDNIKRTERAKKMLDLQVKRQTPKPTTQVAHYEPEGDLVDEGLLGSLDKVVRNTAGSIGGTIGKNKGQQTGIPGGAAVGEIIGRNKGTSTYDKLTKPVRDLRLPGLNNSYEPDGEIVEDIEERRKQLAQRSKEGIEGFKQRISARVNANRKRLAKKREKEQLKRELKSELKN